MLLGIDVSTSITAATIVDKDGKRLYSEAWDFRNKRYFPDTWSKIDFISNKLRDLVLDYSIDHVFIEKPVMSFKKGQSSASTIALLTKFNGMVGLKCYEILGIKPNEISAIMARNRNGIKIPRGSNAKKIVMKHLLDNDPDFVVEYTSHGNPKPKYYDIADSLVVARAGLACLKKS